MMQELTFRYGVGVVMMIASVIIGAFIPQPYWILAIIATCVVMVWRIREFYDSNYFLIGLGGLSTAMAMYIVAWLVGGGWEIIAV